MALPRVRLIPPDTHIPFVRYKNIAIAISLAGIFASIVGLFMVGINFGIDFKGGGNIEITTQQDANLERMRGILRKLDIGDVEVRQFGSPKEVLIRFERQTSDDPSVNVEQLQQQTGRKVHLALYEQYSGLNVSRSGDDVTLQAKYPLDVKKGEDALKELGIADLTLQQGDNPDTVITKLPEGSNTNSVYGEVSYRLLETYATVTSQRTEIVGPKVSDELKIDGLIAVLGALFCMLLYITFRFEWQFAVGAVGALAHDVILTMGMFTLTGIEFNLASIAAVLTIVGYSMNDTVVVYDRIRETMRMYKKMPMAQLLNEAINKTLTRTTMTSFTTLMALVALYFLGGESLKGFAFTMIWGVVVGTYSSIFIAAPILMFLNINRDLLDDDK